MKQFLTFLALLLTFSVSAQTFQVATKIVASPDCKLKFLNKIDSQIYEVNSVDMTWQYLTTTTIKIKDYDNEVTIYKNNITSPIFANIPSFLDSVQGACMGGTGGGGGVQSIVAGTNITVDDTDPQNPIVSASGGSGSDSTIYKADGSTDELRTAEFNGGLFLKNEINGDMIILSDIHKTFNTGMSSGNSMFIVGDGFTYIIGDTTTFANSDGGLGFDSLNLSFWNLQQRLNPNYLLSVDTISESIGVKRYLLKRTPANFLPKTFTENQVIQADTFSFSMIGDSIGFYQNIEFNELGFPARFSGFISQKDNVMSLSGQMLGFPSAPDVWIPIQAASNNVGYSLSTLLPGMFYVSGENTGNEFNLIVSDSELSYTQGSSTITITANDMVVPKPPSSGNYVLKSADGVVSWVAE